MSFVGGRWLSHSLRKLLVPALLFPSFLPFTFVINLIDNDWQLQARLRGVAFAAGPGAHERQKRHFTFVC